MKNDMQIQHEVLAEIGREQRIIAGSVGVEVQHGVVKLAGRVSDGATRESAELAARRVDEVTSIVMDIDVSATSTAPSRPPILRP